MSSSSSRPGARGCPPERQHRSRGHDASVMGLSPLEVELPGPGRAAGPESPPGRRSAAGIRRRLPGRLRRRARRRPGGRGRAKPPRRRARAEALPPFPGRRSRSICVAARRWNCTGLEDALARAAVDLAAAVVGRELQLSASPGADALARALAPGPGSGDVPWPASTPTTSPSLGVGRLGDSARHGHRRPGRRAGRLHPRSRRLPHRRPARLRPRPGPRRPSRWDDR